MDEKKVRETIEEFNKQLLKYKELLDCCNTEYERKPFERIIQYFETAIEALEKQLPKKPLMTEDKQFALCPCCDGRGLLDNQSYCNDCGQHIDWSEQL